MTDSDIMLKLKQMDENIQNINMKVNDFIQFKHSIASLNLDQKLLMIKEDIQQIRCGMESDGKFHRLDTYFIDLNQKLSQLIENQKYIDTIIGSHNKMYHDLEFKETSS